MKASKTIRIEWCFKWVSLRLKIAGAIVTEPVLGAQEFFDWGEIRKLEIRKLVLGN